MAQVNLNDEQLNTIVAKAVLDAITPEKREELIGNAVKHLLAGNPDGASSYGDQRSRLQRAFDAAVGEVAMKVAREHVETSEIQAQCKALIAEAVDRVMGAGDDAREKLVSDMAYKIRTALTGDRY